MSTAEANLTTELVRSLEIPNSEPLGAPRNLRPYRPYDKIKSYIARNTKDPDGNYVPLMFNLQAGPVPNYVSWHILPA